MAATEKRGSKSEDSAVAPAAKPSSEVAAPTPRHNHLLDALPTNDYERIA
jgi:hypothetical protein